MAEKRVIRAEHKNEEGRKCVEKIEIEARKAETIKHVERKLMDKGVQRMERHPSDWIPLTRPPPKSGRGGKYTWEGPRGVPDYEMEPDPPAVDERDPNYVADEEEEQEEPVEEEKAVVGTVEVAKKAPGGVARVEVDPKLSTV